MSVDITTYKPLYLKTARKLIEEYVSIQSSPETERTTQDLLRIFHTLKGQSMAMGYYNIATLSFQVEIFCRTLGDNKLPDILLKKSSSFSKVLYDDLDSIEKTNKEISLTKETESIQRIIEGINSA